MAPGNQSLYMHLSLKIRGIIKLLSHGVRLRSVLRVNVYLFAHAFLYLGVVFQCACVSVRVCVRAWEEHTVTEIDGEGKAGHYVV